MTIFVPQSIEELSDGLSDSGIDVSLYGKGEAKDLEDLLKEIRKKESVLEINPDTSGLIRKVEVALARVFYEADDIGDLELYEAMQVFKALPGEKVRTRKRDYLTSSVAEKSDPGEGGTQMMLRGMKEELKIILESDQYKELVNKSSIVEECSPSFPELNSIYKTHVFNVLLNDEQYKPYGYTEDQKKKVTFFQWRERTWH